MRSICIDKRMWLAAGLLSAGLFLPAVSNGQQQPTRGTSPAGPATNSLTVTDSVRAGEQINTAYLLQTLGDPKEEAAYQAFHKAPGQDLGKKIKLGDAFLAKYPKSRYSAAVYQELCQTYYENKDLASFYTFSDRGLALFPDDVYLLALSGWVIPRAYTPSEPGADQKLDKAEWQSRHALDVLSKMEKPATATDEQFAQFKTGESAVAHSGLGLVYFRREKYDESAKELQLAVQGEANPDQSDLFVLGADLQNIGQYKEAADAFNRCAQITGGMQDKCKEYAGEALKHADEAK
jgi:tetratricopeptide (TPR) repeat protein